MVATVAVFVLTFRLDDTELETYMLSHGEGLHPLQWITSNFLHANILHLVGT